MRGLKVLVVDDDRDFAETVAEVLELEGHQVELSFSGEEGVERFNHGRYDIAFLDVKLPGKNGVESFKEMHRVHPETPVIMMTGFQVDHLTNAAMAGGARAVMHKPLNPRMLLQTVSDLARGA